MARRSPPRLMKQYVTVVDDRTTIVCLTAAGQIQPLDQPFDTMLGPYQQPPVHIHCRATMAPWLPGFLSGMRVDANAEIRRRPAKQRRRGPDGSTANLPPRLEPAPGSRPSGEAAEVLSEAGRVMASLPAGSWRRLALEELVRIPGLTEEERALVARKVLDARSFSHLPEWIRLLLAAVTALLRGL